MYLIVCDLIYACPRKGRLELVVLNLQHFSEALMTKWWWWKLTSTPQFMWSKIVNLDISSSSLSAVYRGGAGRQTTLQKELRSPTPCRHLLLHSMGDGGLLVLEQITGSCWQSSKHVLSWCAITSYNGNSILYKERTLESVVRLWAP